MEIHIVCLRQRVNQNLGSGINPRDLNISYKATEKDFVRNYEVSIVSKEGDDSWNLERM